MRLRAGRCVDVGHDMGKEEAFRSLTLLVAVCEQATLDVERLKPLPEALLEKIAAARAAAIETAAALALEQTV
jgi:hypothetical protein